MISAVAESPEYFPLTVGFSPRQLTALVFDEDLEPVGVLGLLMDPTSASSDAGGMLDTYGQFDISMLGVITGERLAELIADPPEKGQMVRGWLGISLQALTPDIAEFWGLDIGSGIIVSDVVTNSPAQQAGLVVGDVIFEIDGETIEVDREDKVPVFQRRIARLGPGTAIELAIVRTPENDPKKIRLTATLGDAPMAASDAPEYKNETLEFGVRDMVLADYMIRQLDADSFAGSVISEIKQGGPSDVGGLQLGDIIQRIGNETVSSKDDVAAIMETIESEKPEEVIFFIWRRNQTMFVNVKISW
jgi:serine protease Do